jgi:hypothetical protein
MSPRTNLTIILMLALLSFSLDSKAGSHPQKPKPSAAKPKAAPASVTLTVVTKRPGFAVSLDNQPVGTTDDSGQLVIPNVKPGSHSVKLSREGYADVIEIVTLNADRTLTVPPAQISYETGLQMIHSYVSTGKTDQALSALQAIAAEESTRPEAYQLMGQIYYDQGDFSQAGEMFGRAIDRGGQAVFTVTHDDLGGPTPVNEWGDRWIEFCRGELIITSRSVQFKAGLPRHAFTVSRAEIRDVGGNLRVGSKLGAFHIKIRIHGRDQTFNFAPKTKGPDERNMIVDLLSAQVK